MKFTKEYRTKYMRQWRLKKAKEYPRICPNCNKNILKYRKRLCNECAEFNKFISQCLISKRKTEKISKKRAEIRKKKGLPAWGSKSKKGLKCIIPKIN